MGKNILRVEFEYDFIGIGILSSHKNYSLCNYLNNNFGWDLKKSEDIQIDQPKGGNSSIYSLYTDSSNEPEIIYMINNKGSNQLFLPELRNIDYLLIFQNPSSQISKENLIAHLRALSNILGVFDIEIERLKSKENLLYLG